MAKTGVTLKSSLRKTVLKAYRARGKSRNNLFLVYSAKTDSDWILPSDRQLVHWLSVLESDPNVHDFDLAPEPVLSEDKTELRATELDAVVTLQDGEIEWHEVKAGEDKNDPAHASQKAAQQNAASEAHALYRRFDDTDLKPKVRVAMRWLKAIGFAAAIRGEDHTQSRSALVMAMRECKRGNVQALLTRLEDHDQAVLLGLLVRLAISGVVTLDLKKSTFGLRTTWEYRE